jgi:hypothetical protein
MKDDQKVMTVPGPGMTENQKTALAFLLSKPDEWLTPTDVVEASSWGVTAGGCARILRTLVNLGHAEMRENGTYSSGFPKVEYKAKAAA